MPTTRPMVGSSNSRWPFRARSAASIAYATEETGSAITANAKAKNSIALPGPLTRRAGQATEPGSASDWVSALGLIKVR
jgi:hypothetical protein